MSTPRATPSRPIRLGIWPATAHASHAVLSALPAHYHTVHLSSPSDARDLDLLWIDGVAGCPRDVAALAIGLPTVVRVLPSDVWGEGVLTGFEWKGADRVMFDSDAHQALVREMHAGLLPGSARGVTLRPAVDVVQRSWDAERTAAFNVGWRGTLDAGAAALLYELLSELSARDERYQLHVAGPIADVAQARALAYRAEQTGLDRHLHLYGPLAPSEESGFYAQCSHVVVTDVLGGHPDCALQALASGARAVVRDYDGSRSIFPADLLWNTVGQATDQIADAAGYAPAAYRAFASDHYDRSTQIAQVTGLLDRLFADADAGRASLLFADAPTHVGADARARYADAVAHAQEGRTDRASDLMDGLDIAALADGEQLGAHLMGLQLALATDATDRALAHADAATDLAPDEPLALNLAGRALWSAGHDRAGLELLIAAAERSALPSALPFDSDQIRRDASDAARAMGLPDVAVLFADADSVLA